MKTSIIYLVSMLVAGILLGAGVRHVAEAQGAAAVQLAEELDAGVQAPEPAGGIATSPAPDPMTDPGGAAAVIRDLFKSGRPLLAVVAFLWVVARLLHGISIKWPTAPPVRWLRLRNKHVRTSLVVSAGVIAAVWAPLAATGAIDWWAVAGALFGALALYMTAEPTVANQPVTAPECNVAGDGCK